MRRVSLVALEAVADLEVVDNLEAVMAGIEEPVAVTAVEVLLHFMFDITRHTVPALSDPLAKRSRQSSETRGEAVCPNCITEDGTAREPGGTHRYLRKGEV
jgi:hypothetical protein